MYENILVAVDMSETSDRAVRAARDLAKLSGGKVTVLHVQERPLLVGQGGDQYDFERPQDVDALFAKDSAVLIEAAVPFATDLRRAVVGHAAEEIVEAAGDHDAGVIVIGSRGRSALAHLLLGSTAYKVVHLADRPVLIVR